MVVAYIKQQEEELPRPKVIEQAGKKLRRLPKRRTRQHVSVFGPTPFRRDAYATRETQRQEIVPLDAKLGMPEGNTSHVKYDVYLAAGYPIGSGVVEGACRHLVKDRMEQSGMRWRIEGAQAILNLRAIYVNDDWAPFHAARIQAEQHKLYPYRQRLLAVLTCAT